MPADYSCPDCPLTRSSSNSRLVFLALTVSIRPGRRKKNGHAVTPMISAAQATWGRSYSDIIRQQLEFSPVSSPDKVGASRNWIQDFLTCSIRAAMIPTACRDQPIVRDHDR